MTEVNVPISFKAKCKEVPTLVHIFSRQLHSKAVIDHQNVYVVSTDN